PHWSTTRELSAEEQQGWKGRVPTSGFLPDSDDWLGRARFAANSANDYMHSRRRQRTSNFSGFEDVTPIQDAAMQESMGPICDRTREHLGASDAAIVQMRRRLLNAANELTRNLKSPPGVDNPECYRKHGDQMLLNEPDSWAEHYAAKMKAEYEGIKAF
ncbi:MAG TPA: hypothetical protein VKV04_18290, partial [Verrucomicrobiae bacterium]|nr:hypothetical protein [Verrucomicrobiae bacterium]